MVDTFIGAITMFLEKNSELITGALITLMTSIATFVLTTFSNWQQEKRRREWQKEDFRLQRRSEVIKKRTEDIEIFIEKFITLHHKAEKIKEKLLDYNDLEVKENLEQARILIEELEKKSVSVQSLEDNLLNDLYFKLIEMKNKEFEDIAKVYLAKINKKSINKNELRKQFSNSSNNNILAIAGKIINRLDKIAELN